MRYDEKGKLVKDFILNNEPIKFKILWLVKISDVARPEACAMGSSRLRYKMRN